MNSYDADWALVERLEVECDAELPHIYGEATLTDRARRLLDVSSEDGNRLSEDDRASLKQIAE